MTSFSIGEKTYGFDLTRRLGDGCASVVYAGRSDTGERVAVKVLNLDAKRNTAAAIQREVDAYEKVAGHPNIVKCHGVFFDLEYPRAYVVQERARADLFEFFNKGQYTFTVPQALNVLVQVVRALHRCHTKNLAHRDIKLENFLVFKNGVVKLTDFGFVTAIAPARKFYLPCGSLSYAAPEVCRGCYDERSDIWSLGVALFLLLEGKLPFTDDSGDHRPDWVQTGQTQTQRKLPSDVLHLIARMLTVNPAKRITLGGILRHPAMLSHANELPEGPHARAIKEALAPLQTPPSPVPVLSDAQLKDLIADYHGLL